MSYDPGLSVIMGSDSVDQIFFVEYTPESVGPGMELLEQM